jgi:hypothetical protein
MHCPLDCEHPQPFEQDGVLYCGRCYFKPPQSILTAMVPCTPDICTDAHEESETP